MPAPHSRLPLALALLALAAPLPAQQGSFVARHFHPYPASGQWSTESQAFRGGQPLAPPETTTTCTSPLSPARQAAVINFGNAAAPSTCHITTLADTERTAEYEQVCNTGVVQQTIHTTLHAVDDRTLSLEVRSSFPGQEPTVIHQTAHYLGACSAADAQAAAAQAAAPLPSLKPSPEDCAGVPEMKQQAQDGLKGCDSADLPGATRANCKASMTALTKTVEQLEQRCKAH